MMIHVPHHPVDDHPATVFGLIVGTLAVLVTVLVFSIYGAAQENSKHRGPLPQPSLIRR